MTDGCVCTHGTHALDCTESCSEGYQEFVFQYPSVGHMCTTVLPAGHPCKVPCRTLLQLLSASAKLPLCLQADTSALAGHIWPAIYDGYAAVMTDSRQGRLLPLKDISRASREQLGHRRPRESAAGSLLDTSTFYEVLYIYQH